MRDLQADLELCSKATPGPWKYEREKIEVSDKLTLIFETVQYAEGQNLLRLQDKPTAEFIAAAREGWPEAIERALAAEETMAMWKGICENSPTQELDEQYYKEKIAALREENEKLKNELGSVKYIRDKYQGELVAKEILDDEFENGELVKLLAVVDAASDKRKLMCEPCKSKVIGEYEEKPNCNACVLGSVMQALADMEGGKA